MAKCLLLFIVLYLSSSGAFFVDTEQKRDVERYFKHLKNLNYELAETFADQVNDSTLKSDLTVGPPIDFVVYKKNGYKILSQKCLNITDDEYSKVCNQWSDGIFKIFNSFPRFDWEK